VSEKEVEWGFPEDLVPGSGLVCGNSLRPPESFLYPDGLVRPRLRDCLLSPTSLHTPSFFSSNNADVVLS